MSIKTGSSEQQSDDVTMETIRNNDETVRLRKRGQGHSNGTV